MADPEAAVPDSLSKTRAAPEVYLRGTGEYLLIVASIGTDRLHGSQFRPRTGVTRCFIIVKQGRDCAVPWMQVTPIDERAMMRALLEGVDSVTEASRAWGVSCTTVSEAVSSESVDAGCLAAALTVLSCCSPKVGRHGAPALRRRQRAAPTCSVDSPPVARLAASRYRIPLRGRGDPGGSSGLPYGAAK